MNNIEPLIGSWYKDLEFSTLFEVVALDQDEDCIEVQYFSGEIEEFDFEAWDQMQIELVPAPEDWTGPFEIEPDDFAYDEPYRPQDWDNPLSVIERDFESNKLFD